MDPVEVIFGKFPLNLRYLREAEGISQVELSKRVHISLATIQKIERGDAKTLRSDFLGRFAVFYNVTADEILSGNLSNVEPVRTRFYHQMARTISSNLLEGVMLSFDATRQTILDGEPKKK